MREWETKHEDRNVLERVAEGGPPEMFLGKPLIPRQSVFDFLSTCVGLRDRPESPEDISWNIHSLVEMEISLAKDLGRAIAGDDLVAARQAIEKGATYVIVDHWVSTSSDEARINERRQFDASELPCRSFDGSLSRSGQRPLRSRASEEMLSLVLPGVEANLRRVAETPGLSSALIATGRASALSSRGLLLLDPSPAPAIRSWVG